LFLLLPSARYNLTITNNGHAELRNVTVTVRDPSLVTGTPPMLNA